MSTGPDREPTRRIVRYGPTGRSPEIMVVPPALYTLRTIVLGAAALLGVVGVAAFAQMPVTNGGPAEAAEDLAARAGCGSGCLGRAGAIREIDVLPVAIDTGTLAVFSRAAPEAPMAATPPPPAAHQAGPGDRLDERTDQDPKPEKSAGKGHGEKEDKDESRDRDERDDDDD